MSIRSFLMVGCALISFPGNLLAQQAAEFPTPEGPTAEHQLLERFTGEWATTSEGSMGPDQPPMTCIGTMKSSMLGSFWVVNNMRGEVMGTPMHGIQTIGYDTTKKKYVGTWVDSMMNHLWRYEGSYDPDSKKLTLEADGPNFMAGGKTTKFRDAYEFAAPDRIIATSSMLTEEGKWVTFMSGEITRKK